MGSGHLARTVDRCGHGPREDARPVLEEAVRRIRAGAGVDGPAHPRHHGRHLQRPRQRRRHERHPHPRAREGRVIPSGRRGMGQPPGTRCHGRSRVLRPPRQELDRRLFRPHRVPGTRRRPRPDRSPVGVLPLPRRTLALRSGPPPGQRHPVPADARSARPSAHSPRISRSRSSPPAACPTSSPAPARD